VSAEKQLELFESADDAALLERLEAALQLVRSGQLDPLDALAVVVWPSQELLARQAA
jgi:hypothetical protein